MRYALLVATVAAALVASPAFAANGNGGNGNGQDKKAQAAPSESQTTLVSGPTQIDPASIPSGAADGAVVAGAAALPTTASCGACIVTCWYATSRSGPNDWSGHVYIYQHLTWCGNGATVTYGSVWQSYDQSGWYTLSSAYGPWWSGGCIGCYTLRASGYILWQWHSALVSVAHSGSSHLDSTMYAYGGLTF
jgi:hypothetical protein